MGTSLKNLLCFAETARHASFARAARVLGLSPSAVAKSVANLESALGVRLFHRTTRQVALSSDGRELFQRCQRVLEEIDGLHSAAEGSRLTPRGTLRIDVPVTYGKKVIVPVIAELVMAHPDLGFDVRFSDRFADLVGDGLDAAIRVGTLNDSRFVARKFDEQLLLVCASPQYLERRGMPRSPADIRKHDCLGFRSNLTGRERSWRLRKGRAETELVPESRIVFDDGEAAAHALIAGLGLMQLPNYYVEQSLREGRLVEVLNRFRPPPEPISVVYPSRRQVPQRLRVFIDALASIRNR